MRLKRINPHQRAHLRFSFWFSGGSLLIMLAALAAITFCGD